MADNEKISEELSIIIKNIFDGVLPVKKIPIIISLNNEAELEKISKEIISQGNTIDLRLPEPIPIISCSIHAAKIKYLASFSEIKKIEYDGKTYAL